MRQAERIAKGQAQEQLEASRQREEALQTRLALAEAEQVARQRLAEMRAIDDAKSAESATSEVAGLRASLERLTTMVAASVQGQAKSPRKRSNKPEVTALHRGTAENVTAAPHPACTVYVRTPKYWNGTP